MWTVFFGQVLSTSSGKSNIYVFVLLFIINYYFAVKIYPSSLLGVLSN